MSRVEVGPWGAVPVALCQDVSITANEIRAYIAIASCQGSNRSVSFPIEFLANRAGISTQAFSKATTGLSKKKWITRNRQLGNSNIYSCLHEVDPSEISKRFKRGQKGGRLKQMNACPNNSKSTYPKESDVVGPNQSVNIIKQKEKQKIIGNGRNKNLMRQLYKRFPLGQRPWTKDSQLYKKLRYYQEKGSFEAMVLCVQEYQEQTG